MSKEIMAECLAEAKATWDSAGFYSWEDECQKHKGRLSQSDKQGIATLAAALYAERMRREALPIHPHNVYGPQVPTVTTTYPKDGETTWGDASTNIKEAIKDQNDDSLHSARGA